MSNQATSLDEKKSISDEIVSQFENGEQVDEVHESDYSEEQYKKLLRKIVSCILCCFSLSDPQLLTIRIGIFCL